MFHIYSLLETRVIIGCDEYIIGCDEYTFYPHFVPGNKDPGYIKFDLGLMSRTSTQHMDNVRFRPGPDVTYIYTAYG